MKAFYAIKLPLARGNGSRDSLHVVVVKRVETFCLWMFRLQTRDSMAAGMPDVLPGGPESLDASVGHQATTPQHWAEPPVRRKESVARMTFGGLAFVVAVSRGTGDVALSCDSYNRTVCVLMAVRPSAVCSSTVVSFGPFWQVL